MSSAIFKIIFIQISGRSHFISDVWIYSSISCGQCPFRTLKLNTQFHLHFRRKQFWASPAWWKRLRTHFELYFMRATNAQRVDYTLFVSASVSTEPNFVAHLIARHRRAAAERGSRPNLRDREFFPSISPIIWVSWNLIGGPPYFDAPGGLSHVSDGRLRQLFLWSRRWFVFRVHSLNAFDFFEFHVYAPFLCASLHSKCNSRLVVVGKSPQEPRLAHP